MYINNFSQSQPSHTKDLENGNRHTQLSTKLESEIDKPERWLASGQMLCERLLCPNGELNALLGPPTHLQGQSMLGKVKIAERINAKNF